MSSIENWKIKVEKWTCLFLGSHIEEGAIQDLLQDDWERLFQ